MAVLPILATSPRHWLVAIEHKVGYANPNRSNPRSGLIACFRGVTTRLSTLGTSDLHRGPDST